MLIVITCSDRQKSPGANVTLVCHRCTLILFNIRTGIEVNVTMRSRGTYPLIPLKMAEMIPADTRADGLF